MASAKPRQHAARVILLGEDGIGKSNLFYRIKHRRFKDSSTMDATNESNALLGHQGRRNVGYDSCSRNVIITPELHVKVTVVDNTGGDSRQSLSFHNYRRIQAVLLVCSLDSEYSLTRLGFWLEEARQYVKDQRTMFIVVGTKCDLPDDRREVTMDMLQAFGVYHSLPVFEVSAKTGEGVSEMMRGVATRILEAGQRGTQHSTNDTNSGIRSCMSASEKAINEDTPFITTRDLKQDSGLCCCIL